MSEVNQIEVTGETGSNHQSDDIQKNHNHGQNVVLKSKETFVGSESIESTSFFENSDEFGSKDELDKTGDLPESLIEHLSSESKDSQDSDEKCTSPVEKKKLSPEEKMFRFCSKGTPYHVKYMLNKFPHLISIKDSDNYTPLHKAAYSDNVDVVKCLIESGADIEARTSDGWTPLHCACKWANLATASILIDSGADINAKSVGGITPLHLAATTKNKQLIELLIYNPNVDPDVVNGAGDTPLDIARRYSPYYHLFEQIKY